MVRTYEDFRKILALSVSERAHAIIASFEYNLHSRSSQTSILDSTSQVNWKHSDILAGAWSWELFVYNHLQKRPLKLKLCRQGMLINDKRWIASRAKASQVSATLLSELLDRVDNESSCGGKRMGKEIFLISCLQLGTQDMEGQMSPYLEEKGGDYIGQNLVDVSKRCRALSYLAGI